MDVDIFSIVIGSTLPVILKGEFYNFLSKAFGNSAELVKETVINEYKNFNDRRLADSLVKCYIKFEEAKIIPQKVPRKLIKRLIENISDDNDVLIQDMWDMLLGLAIAGNKDKKYIITLEQLDSLEANILNIIFEWANTNNKPNNRITGTQISQKLKLQEYTALETEIEKSLNYIMNISLIHRIGYSKSEIEEVSLKNDLFVLTTFGLDFMKTVTGKNI